MGAAFLLMGLGGLWSHASLKSGPGAFWSSVLTWTAIFLMIEEPLSGWIVGWLKARITYPRTGYVAPPLQQALHEPVTRETFFPQKRTRTREEVVDGIQNVTFFSVALVAFLFHQRWMFALAVLLHVYLSWHFRKWVHIPWYKKYLAPVAGLLWTFLPLPLNLSWEVVPVGSGLCLLGTGIVHLTVYLKRHPRYA
jgi:hypothetical protein